MLDSTQQDIALAVKTLRDGTDAPPSPREASSATSPAPAAAPASAGEPRLSWPQQQNDSWAHEITVRPPPPPSLIQEPARVLKPRPRPQDLFALHTADLSHGAPNISKSRRSGHWSFSAGDSIALADRSPERRALAVRLAQRGALARVFYRWRWSNGAVAAIAAHWCAVRDQ